jgi:hypothetical protein
VRRRGLEPLCLAALAPKASASANFATSALFKPGATVVASLDKTRLRTRQLLNCTVSLKPAHRSSRGSLAGLVSPTSAVCKRELAGLVSAMYDAPHCDQSWPQSAAAASRHLRRSQSIGWGQMDCKQCGQAKLARMPRTSFLQKFLYSSLGYYPWICPICKAEVLRKHRGERRRKRRTPESEREFASRPDALLERAGTGNRSVSLQSKGRQGREVESDSHSAPVKEPGPSHA